MKATGMIKACILKIKHIKTDDKEKIKAQCNVHGKDTFGSMSYNLPDIRRVSTNTSLLQSEIKFQCYNFTGFFNNLFKTQILTMRMFSIILVSHNILNSRPKIIARIKKLSYIYKKCFLIAFI